MVLLCLLPGEVFPSATRGGMVCSQPAVRMWIDTEACCSKTTTPEKDGFFSSLLKMFSTPENKFYKLKSCAAQPLPEPSVMSPSCVKSCRIVFNLPKTQSRSFPKTKKMLFKAAQAGAENGTVPGLLLCWMLQKSLLLSGGAFPPAAHHIKPPS